MEKVESALDVLSRAATMVQPAFSASDSEGFETPSTASSGESEGDRTPEAVLKDSTGKWRRERRSTRLPDYRENGKMALRSQSFNERRGPSTAPVPATHSDGEFSDGTDEPNISKGAPPEYPGPRAAEVPIDMRLRARPAPPPYSRPSVITRSTDTPPGSISMCDPVIDEHFRRSLGDDYMTLFKKTPQGTRPTTQDRASSPILFNKPQPNPSPPPKTNIAMEVDDASLSVDDHFAKALGDTWKQIQTSRLKDNEKTKECKGVDDHFTKALGDTWKNISKTIDKSDKDKPKESSKIISRSGVVI